MKEPVDRLVVAVALIVAIAFAAGCSRSSTVQASFTVEGMHCESCSSAIIDAFGKIEGVETVSADHVTGSAEAIFKSPTVSADQLAAEIEGLGYTVTAVETAPVEG